MTEFSASDLTQIKNHGLTPDTVLQQLHDFETGFPYSNIVSAAVVGDGIMATPGDDTAGYFRANRDKYKIVKFVPASGAATRMFRDLYTYLDSGEMNKTTQTVLDNLTEFAFWDDLKQTLPENADAKTIISHIISTPGLNYGKLPKALLKFHKYPTESRTAIAEHMAEGAQYAASNGTVNIHFTISPEHRTGFDTEIAKLSPEYAARFGVTFNITMSTQMPKTDTIAVNMDNTPFRDENGKLLFRPAGHGALIENLNQIDADLIFIKNIDNICPDDARPTTIFSKETLAGIAIKIQNQIFDYIRALDGGTADTKQIATFINSTLGTRGISPNATQAQLREILNRPLRVCGMIKNTGEPGGGPFWTRDAYGRESLQIAEPGQIAPEQKHILTTGEYFNPTDLVCMPRDAYGNHFDLLKYVDASAGFISEKSASGRPLRAMERPGLWNGAMAHWNTVFVVIPPETFTPAKIVSDLIAPTHRTK